MEDIQMEQAIEILSKVNINSKKVKLPLLKALGKTIAEDIKAPFDNPPFNRSPLDGYTFNSESVKNASKSNPSRLKIIGQVCAGHFFDKEVKLNQAINIMTGAMIPENCDCVIRQEDIKIDEEGNLLVFYPLSKYQNYCFQGEDIKKDAIIIKKNTCLNAAHIGVLASMGIGEVLVYNPLRIGVLSTGDEILDVDKPLTKGKIYNSNLYLLISRLEELGIKAINLGSIKDDVDLVKSKIKSIKGELDVLITTGGVSVGKMDIMHDVVKSLKAKRIFWRLLMKPGSPMLTYQYDSLLGIALSGNPFAALATFELVVRPVLARLSYLPHLNWQYVKGELQDDFNKKSIGRRFIRAKYSDGKLYLTNKDASGMLFSAINCNAFIDIPEGTPYLKKGEIVKAVLINKG